MSQPAWPRHITRFESRDGQTVVTFPVDQVEYESTQGIRTAFAEVVGMDYAHDQHGYLPAPVAVGQERIRAMLYSAPATGIDSAADELRAELRSIGQGRLYSLGADGTERWCWARATSMPSMTVSYDKPFSAPVSLEFARTSNWYSTVLTVIEQVVVASPTTINVVNPGTADVRDAVFLIDSNAAGGFSNPKLSNALTGEAWQSLRTAANASAQVRVDAWRESVEYSMDNGGSWTGDYANFSTNAVQVGFMRFRPGSQPVVVTGVINARVRIEFYAAFA